jgi:hypothetical protein
MRYEMVMFPAAAVAAGGLITLLIGQYLPGPAKDAELAAAAEAEAVAAAAAPSSAARRRFTPGFVTAAAATAPGRFLGLHLPRPERWKPQLILNSVVLAVVVGITLDGSWSSTAAAPPSPSYAAAQGGSGYAVRPLARPTAEQTMKAMFQQAVGLAHDSGQLQGSLDWAHSMRYRPTATDQPGWNTRDKDGTAVVNPNSMGQDLSMSEAYGRGLSLDATVKPDTVKILSSQVSEYGEDVVFTIEDKAGVVHQGTATFLYPIWHRQDPATVTSLVFDA